jgi:hemerythrin-like domain-containing protein
METIDILCAEHRIIERALTALETGTWMLSVNEPLPAGFFSEMVDLITGFADACHHQKEEGVLFKAAGEMNDTQGNKMIAAMLHEHELARSYTNALRQATQRLLDGDKKASSDLINQSRHYTALLRNHIAMEDKFVFPYIAQILPSERIAEIDHLAELDSQAQSEIDDRGKYISLVEHLEKQVWITPQE